MPRLLNKEVYEKEDVVNYYAESLYLDKPEISILYRLGGRLKNMRMLDIGVGGGRTTHYFAPLAGDYTGIDYAENMVRACERQFEGIKFSVCDVRDMKMFGDGAFDFVLFSMNGLDSIPHEDRPTALREIRRVLAPGGVFYFSAHNLRYIYDINSKRFSTEPRQFYYFIAKYILLALNGTSIRRLGAKSHAMIKDGAHSGRLSLYYVKPEEQVKQLLEAGFKNIKVLSTRDGMEVRGPLEGVKDQWVGYLCEA